MEAVSFLRLGGVSYQSFLFPGIVAISLVSISMHSGISVIWDREFGFLKEILVAPVSRTSIFFGKVLGGCTTALLQGIIILSLSFLFNIQISLQAILLSIIVMLMISVSIVSLGLIIASFIETFEGFGLIMNFIIFPMIFLSGAFFPLDQSPKILQIISYFDPLTYGVNLLRHILIGISSLPFILNFSVLLLFVFITVLIGGFTFNRQR